MELLEQILSDDNLDKAIKQVKKNKGSAGVDKMSTKDLDNVFTAEYRENLKEQLRTRKYKPQPIRRKEIPKPDGGVRKLGIPTVIDRIIQQAITQVLTPIYEEQFSETSYGFRPKRSAHMAIEKVLEYTNNNYKWIVDIDLEKFFDKVNHDKMMQILSETIKDGDVLSIIRKYLKSGIMINDEYKEAIIGTPQGGNLSPLLGNVILDLLDKELEKRELNFVRYADDCLIFARTEKSADRIIKSITKFIKEKLLLKVNATKSKVSKIDKVKYLGFGFYISEGLVLARPHESSIERLKFKIKEITSRSNGMSMVERLQRLAWLFRGWYNYFKKCKIKYILKKIDEHTRYRLRICIWKSWKKNITKFRALMKLGITRQKAWEWANSRKSCARIARSFIMHRAVTNERLKRKGFISFESLYV
jgi:group II intron reverse transcriptase/maturase